MIICKTRTGRQAGCNCRAWFCPVISVLIRSQHDRLIDFTIVINALIDSVPLLRTVSVSCLRVLSVLVFLEKLDTQLFSFSFLHLGNFLFALLHVFRHFAFPLLPLSFFHLLLSFLFVLNLRLVWVTLFFCIL